MNLIKQKFTEEAEKSPNIRIDTQYSSENSNQSLIDELLLENSSTDTSIRDS